MGSPAGRSRCSASAAGRLPCGSGTARVSRSRSLHVAQWRGLTAVLGLGVTLGSSAMSPLRACVLLCDMGRQDRGVCDSSQHTHATLRLLCFPFCGQCPPWGGLRCPPASPFEPRPRPHCLRPSSHRSGQAHAQNVPRRLAGEPGPAVAPARLLYPPPDGHVRRLRHHDGPAAGRDHPAHPAVQPLHLPDQVTGTPGGPCLSVRRARGPHAASCAPGRRCRVAFKGADSLQSGGEPRGRWAHTRLPWRVPPAGSEAGQLDSPTCSRPRACARRSQV